MSTFTLKLFKCGIFDHVHECIAKSQSRGKQAAIHAPLKISSRRAPKQSAQNQLKVRLPQCYICNESDNAQSCEASLLFTPAGSTKDDEYNVITFYSFDSSFVKSMLDGESARRDFPFKEWPKEHDIINMKQGKVSILWNWKDHMLPVSTLESVPNLLDAGETC